MMKTAWVTAGLLLVLMITYASAETERSRSGDDSVPLLTDAATADRVSSLPGWGAISGFGLFTGYIAVDQAETRHTFYAFAESLHSPATAPLILWLNGGPGCSSLGGGFMSELGPFFPKPDGTLQTNPHSWNRFANILFIESPHGVGFSYSEHDADLKTGDARTALDSYNFLLRFFQRFPQYAASDLFLSGESYAGHYVPQLAWEIVKGNAAATAASAPADASRVLPLAHVNMVGFLVGNPWTSTGQDNEGAVDFWWSHALISDATSAGLKDNCDFGGISPLMLASAEGGDAGAGLLSVQEQEQLQQRAAVRKLGASKSSAASGRIDRDAMLCDKFVNRAQEELGNINIYEIYADVCLEIKRGGPQRRMAALLGNHPAGLASRVAVAALEQRHGEIVSASVAARAGQTAVVAGAGHGAADAPVTHAVDDDRVAPDDKAARAEAAPLVAQAEIAGDALPDPAYEPCIDNEVELYLNKPDVQRALHANQTAEQRAHLPGRWADCSDRVMYSVKDLLQSVLPVYHNLLKAGVQMLVYSGDVDGILPVIGTRRWVAGLGLTETVPWRAWTSSTQQVGGYIVEYDGLTFASIRNAGHMVPYTQPERMYHLAQLFIGQARQRMAAAGAAPANL